jgi:hypothetical protein
MKVTAHYFDKQGVGRFKELEMDDIYEIHKEPDCGGYLAHVQIGNFNLALDATHLHVARNSFAPKLGDDMLPDDMRNDRVLACRQVYALASYYTSTAYGDREVPDIYGEVCRACREELEHWRNR